MSLITVSWRVLFPNCILDYPLNDDFCLCNLETPGGMRLRFFALNLVDIWDDLTDSESSSMTVCYTSIFIFSYFPDFFLLAEDDIKGRALDDFVLLMVVFLYSYYGVMNWVVSISMSCLLSFCCFWRIWSYNLDSLTLRVGLALFIISIELKLATLSFF